MSIMLPEMEYVNRDNNTIRYLEHGWPSDLCRWHSHPEYELHLIIATHGKAFVGDYIGSFVPGSLFLTGPNVPHNWVSDKQSETQVETRDMLIQFHPTSIDRLCLAFGEFKDLSTMFELAKSGIEFLGFDPVVAQSHMEAIRDTRGPRQIASFMRFLVDIHQHGEKRPLSAVHISQLQGNTKHARIARVVDHISKKFSEEISLNMAAEMAGMSTAAFSRNFYRATGNKFVEFITRVRVGHACSLLYGSDDQISDICFGVGFQNLANFNRQFLKIKHMSPSAFRKLAQVEMGEQRNEA